MTAFNPITPQRAIEIIEPAGLGDAARVLVDFAAAGLVKAYARLIETVDAASGRTEVRDSRISRELWRRIADEGHAAEVWRTGSVRLAGSGMIGGAPAVDVIGIRFDQKIQAVIHAHSGNPAPRRSSTASAAAVLPAEDAEPTPAEARPAMPVGKSAIPDGAVTITIKQAMAALGLGRTTVDKLCREGKLERVRVGGRALITVASVSALAEQGG